MRSMHNSERIFTVAEYIELVNIALKREEVRLVGEVSSVKLAASGHVYFTIKDAKADASLDCVVWRTTYRECGVELTVGMEVILVGHPQIYAPRGSFSFIANSVELHGEGALKKAYDALKKKLSEEGVFAPGRKRALPDLPRRIGIITSLKGAVIHDFTTNLGKFGLELFCADARVEGQQAVGSLIEAVQLLKKQPIDVLVIIRGGGSLESLQGFNNEALIREIIDFPVPVIAGIGHDQDVPLLALAADHMTSTPTAAAHVISEPWRNAYNKIEQVTHLVGRVGQEIRRIEERLTTTQAALLTRVTTALTATRERLMFAQQVIRLHDPTRQLGLGYAIVRRGGAVVKSIKHLAPDTAVQIQVADGSADAIITQQTND